MDISEVNSLSEIDFINIFFNVVENYKECAVWLSKQRPFRDRLSLTKAADDYLGNLSPVDMENVLRLHPDLVGRFADEAHLTLESQLEQMSAGLRNISTEDTAELARLNNEYKDKFEFPFVICARDNKFNSIIRGLKERILHAKEEELNVALSEVKKITYYRIVKLVTDDF